MATIVRTEEIYDALLDEASFDALTQRIARAVDAASYIAGWIYSDGTQILPSAPRHWSSKMIAEYAEHFASTDPWTVATAKNLRPNRATDTSELVPPSEWERSALFNDFLVPNRIALMHSVVIEGQNDTGMGCLAFHRERHQAPFSADQLAALDELAPHVGRMLAFKAKLHRLELTEQMSRLTADGLGQPVFALTADRRILVHNAPAEQWLKAEKIVKPKHNRLDFECVNASQARDAVAAAAGPNSVTATSVLLQGRDGERIIATVVPRVVAGMRCALLWLQGVGGRNHRVAGHLQALFGLTAAEADIAELLGNGHTPSDIAQARGSALGTVRTQIKALLAKMGCGRTSDVIAIVHSIPGSRHDAGFSKVKRP